MGRADARSAEINRPAGVARSFQVSRYKVEPTKSVFARNLFAKDDARSALSNKVVRGGPKVPLISKPAAFACRAERLARAGHCPNSPVVGPSGAAQGVTPDANSGEEVTLCVAAQIVGSDIFNTPFVNITRRDVALLDQFAQPRGGLGVKFVVVSGQSNTLPDRAAGAAVSSPSAKRSAVTGLSAT